MSQSITKNFKVKRMNMEVEELIGVGTNGKIFRAMNKDNKQLRAMKVIPKDSLVD